MPPKRISTALKAKKWPRFIKILHFGGKNVLSHRFLSKWIDIICCEVQNISIHFERNLCHKCAIPARVFLILSWDRKVSRYFGIVLILILNFENLDIGIGIEFEILRYWYWYWYPFLNFEVLVLILVLN